MITYLMKLLWSLKLRYIVPCVLLVSLLTSCTSTATEIPSFTLQVTFSTEPNPLTVGEGYVVIDVADKNGQPLNDINVDVSFGIRSMTIESMDGPVARESGGRYRRRILFHNSGQYTAHVSISRDSQILHEQEFKFYVK